MPPPSLAIPNVCSIRFLPLFSVGLCLEATYVTLWQVALDPVWLLQLQINTCTHLQRSSLIVRPLTKVRWLLQGPRASLEIPSGPLSRLCLMVFTGGHSMAVWWRLPSCLPFFAFDTRRRHLLVTLLGRLVNLYRANRSNSLSVLWGNSEPLFTDNTPSQFHHQSVWMKLMKAGRKDNRRLFACLWFWWTVVTTQVRTCWTSWLWQRRFWLTGARRPVRISVETPVSLRLSVVILSMCVQTLQ
jgi:hypothetical protein